MNKIDAFNALHHQNDVLFLPNVWDVLSALAIEKAGFKALGTTSFGMANAHGLQDGENMSFEQLITTSKSIINAVKIPVSIDIEAGYANQPEVIADNVLAIAQAGAVGINIEDSYKDREGLREPSEQAEILRTIRRRLSASGFGRFFVNARIDTVFQGQPIEQAIKRALLYVEAGASGVFIPGLSATDDIKQMTEAVSAPVNLMSLPNLTSASKLQMLGVKRFSIGNAFSDFIIAQMESASRQMIETHSSKSFYPDNII